MEPIVIDVEEELEIIDYHANYMFPLHMFIICCFIVNIPIVIFAPHMYNVYIGNPNTSFIMCVGGVLNSCTAIFGFWAFGCFKSYRVYDDPSKYTIASFKDRIIVEIKNIDYTFELRIPKDIEIKSNVNLVTEYNICKVALYMNVQYGPYTSTRIEIKHPGFFDVISLTNTVLYKKKG
jgi:hypothetical protein